MGWFRVDHVGARVRRQGTLSVALVKSGGAHGGVSMRVRLSRDVQQVTGLTAGDTLDVDWGEREMAGRILLARAEGDAGAARLRWQHPDAKAAIETRFGGLPDGWFPAADGGRMLLKLETRPAAGCAWTVARTAAEGGAAIEVTLPKVWFVVPAADARPVSRVCPDGTGGPLAGSGAPSPAPPPAPAPVPGPIAAESAEEDPLVAKAMALLSSREPALRPDRGARPAAEPAAVPSPARPEAPRPVDDDKIEQAIRMIGAGKLDSEVIRALRCTPAFLADCKAELSRRRREAGRAAA